MKYTFVPQVDTELMQATAEAWNAQIAENPENTAQPYYEACLPYCERIVGERIPKGDGQVCVSAIQGEDEAHASALLVLAHPAAVSDGGTLRLLNLYVQPSLNLADREPNVGALAWIASHAIVGALGLTYDKFPAQSLKIHTAFPLDHEFMTAITTALLVADDKLSKAYTVKVQGAWIIVTKVAPSEA